MNINIIAAGAYWPRFVVARNASSLRVCSHDEDAITLAVEAGLAALEISGILPDNLDGMYLAIGASPLAEGPVENILGNALGLKNTIATATFSGNELVSLAALFAAGDAVAAGRLKNVLVIASEGGGSPRGQLPGAAAVAVLVSDNGVEPVAIIESVKRDNDVAFHRWRQNQGDGSQMGDYRFLKSFFCEHATGVLNALEKDIGNARYAVFTGAPDKAVRKVMGSAVGGKIVFMPHSVDPGDFGVVGPFLSLLTGWEAVRAGERFLAVSHGSGQTVAMSLKAGNSKTSRVKPPIQYAHCVSRNDDLVNSKNPKLSLPAMSTFFWRNRDSLLRLEAHRCINCGLVAFPPSERPICSKCRSDKWESYQLPRTGSVYTYCVNNYPPDGFPRQVIHILAELSDGTRYWAPASEMHNEKVEIGTPVQLVLRRFTQDEGALVYGMKFLSYKL
jgi:uncharacterized OB-fold protein/3-hydroxy-3-methylglutaryl CoA synthase